MSFRVQELIHKYELGAGRHVLRYALAVIVMAGVAVWYDLAAFRNLSTQEGMDSAQLARNISEGKGYSTDFVRPFSVHLLKKRSLERVDRPAAGTNSAPVAAQEDVVRLNGPHPDLANAPVYPLLLGGALKIMPFAYPDLARNPTKSFAIYMPDLWIAMFNQGLFLAAVVMVFFLGRRLFDEPVGWVSAALLLGTDLFWRFSLSGLSTMVLLLIILGLFWIWSKLEAAARELTPRKGMLILLALAAGCLVGIGALTRYGFGYLIIPVIVMLFLLPVSNRPVLVVMAVMGFLLVLGPWVARNYALSGAPFGTAGFALFENTSLFSEHQLARSLSPNFSMMDSREFWRKFFINAKEVVQNDLPRLGGNWVSALFLAGLLVPFRNPVLSRLRWFLVLSLTVLTLGQAVGRTALSTDSPDINSENLLVVLAPVVFIYGVSLLFTLMDQFSPQSGGLRYFVLGFFCLAACGPLGLTLCSPSPSPVAYPPYFPPWIQEKAHRIGENELLMTDLPWASAWYGRRQSIWLTLRFRAGASEKSKESFFEVNALKPVKALYLSVKTMKTVELQSLEEWLRQDDDSAIFSKLRQAVLYEQQTGEQKIGDADLMAALRERLIANARRESDVSLNWEEFILGTFLKSEVPTGFPLQRAPAGLFPELFLTDSEHVAGKTIQSSK